MRLISFAARLAAATPLVGGLAGLTYARWESQAYVLRAFRVPVLPAGQRPLRLLHLSDLHLTPSQHAKADFIRELADLAPDLVVATGDFLAHRDAVQPVLDCLDELLDAPGAFVLGSNDYFAPILKNPARYLLPSGEDVHQVGAELPWRDLVSALTGRGWVDLDNSRALVDVGDRVVAMAGVDDPHLAYDDLDAVAEPPDPACPIAIAIAHAPYLRVLDRFVGSGWPLVLAGHTHGGQLRVPGRGALVTNCDLDTERCRGLHRHSTDDRTAWMHVSAGLGTSPYAPLRFACRPEASLLTLESPPG